MKAAVVTDHGVHVQDVPEPMSGTILGLKFAGEVAAVGAGPMGLLRGWIDGPLAVKIASY